jgi:hypothetical protein
MKPLRPHSPEWFENLAEKGDEQSLHLSDLANSHIEHYSTQLVCSICGDSPSKEMKLERNSNIIMTLRLCEECHVIRILHHQEVFMPIETKEYDE